MLAAVARLARSRCQPRLAAVSATAGRSRGVSAAAAQDEHREVHADRSSTKTSTRARTSGSTGGGSRGSSGNDADTGGTGGRRSRSVTRRRNNAANRKQTQGRVSHAESQQGDVRGATPSAFNGRAADAAYAREAGARPERQKQHQRRDEREKRGDTGAAAAPQRHQRHEDMKPRQAFPRKNPGRREREQRRLELEAAKGHGASAPPHGSEKPQHRSGALEQRNGCEGARTSGAASPAERPAGEGQGSESSAQHFAQVRTANYIRLLGRRGEWDKALQALARARKVDMLPMNEHLYNAALSGVARKGRWQEAQQLLQDMDDVGVEPNAVSYTYAIMACETAQQLDAVVAVKKEAAARGVTLQVAKSRPADRATTLKAAQTRQDMLQLGKRGDWQGAVRLLEAHTHEHQQQQQRSGGAPAATPVLFHTAFSILGEAKQCGEIERLLKVMDSSGLQRTDVTYNILMDVFSKAGLRERVFQLRDEMRQQQVPADVYTYNSLLLACKDARAVLRLLKEMKSEGLKPNVYCYTTAMKTCNRSNSSKQCLQLMADMKQDGVRPSGSTFNIALVACRQKGRWQKALQLFAEMARQRITPDHLHYTSLMLLLGKAGRRDELLSVVETLQAALEHTTTTSTGTSSSAATGTDVPDKASWAAAAAALYMCKCSSELQALYAMLLRNKVYKNPWQLQQQQQQQQEQQEQQEQQSPSRARCHMLDFHGYPLPLALTAVQVALNEAFDAQEQGLGSAFKGTGGRVHDLSEDLFIITGQNKGNSTLQPALIKVLAAHGMKATRVPDNAGRMVVKAGTFTQLDILAEAAVAEAAVAEAAVEAAAVDDSETDAHQDVDEAAVEEAALAEAAAEEPVLEAFVEEPVLEAAVQEAAAAAEEAAVEAGTVVAGVQHDSSPEGLHSKPTQ
eukprot:TRINITY_DN3264_c0_g1_i1.p1 TRINITY_DN3264_c0_g1~~TRINITY_DN3264_c0_g1_i1.p1  ORF type:complete len:943 (+),score=305.67 TRINITY_DN3264_c0_g1_i1:101-2830(+)